MSRSLRHPLLYPFMTYKTNPMLWYAMKKGWIDRDFANVGLQWCQGRSISLRCQHLVGEDVWERLCKKKKKKESWTCAMLHPMVPYKQWGEGTRQGEAAPKKNKPPWTVVMNGGRCFTDGLQRRGWPAEKAARLPQGRGWVRGGQNTSVTEVVFL